MFRKFLSVYRTPKGTAVFLGASALTLALVGIGFSQKLSSHRQQTPVHWDAAASKELEVQYHKLHDSWNAMDVSALKNMIVGDDVLATFDLDPDTCQPVKLRSKAEMDSFTDKAFNGFKNSKAKVLAEHPMISCRARSDFGVCTEECKVQVFLPDGQKQVQLLRATAVAVKHPDGWKFIQWHMSEAGPSQTFNKDGQLITSP